MKNLALVTVALVSFTLTACGPAAASREKQEAGSAQPEMVFAEGWDGLVITSGGDSVGRTQIDLSTGAHFDVGRTACAVPQSGAINNIEQWNKLAHATNEALKLPPLSEERCFTHPRVPRGFDESVEVKVGTGKQKLIAMKGVEYCTKIPDEAIARDMIDGLNHVVATALMEDCR